MRHCQKGTRVHEDINTLRARLIEAEPTYQPKVGLFGPKRSVATIMVSFGLRFVMVLGFAYLGLTTAKIVMVNELGRSGFEARLEELASGDLGARIASRLLQRDPLMVFIQQNI